MQDDSGVKGNIAENDEEKIEVISGTDSLPVKHGRKIAIKIIDARGIESLKIVGL